MMENQSQSPKKNGNSKYGILAVIIIAGVIATAIGVSGNPSAPVTPTNSSSTNLVASGTSSSIDSGVSSGVDSGVSSGVDSGVNSGVSSGDPSSGTSCYPLSNEGNCYEPGEYCRDSDQGTTGVAGDGESITCTDNDGLRWEPN